ncbi:hypothetical protein C1I92_19150, partial [Jiangella anatolica]
MALTATVAPARMRARAVSARVALVRIRGALALTDAAVPARMCERLVPIRVPVVPTPRPTAARPGPATSPPLPRGPARPPDVRRSGSGRVLVKVRCRRGDRLRASVRGSRPNDRLQRLGRRAPRIFLGAHRSVRPARRAPPPARRHPNGRGRASVRPRRRDPDRPIARPYRRDLRPPRRDRSRPTTVRPTTVRPRRNVRPHRRPSDRPGGPHPRRPSCSA